jgi:hypothetical protein
MIDPKEPLSPTEKHVFGVDAKRHPVLGFVIEQGSGAESIAVQVENYIRMVANTEGADAAEAAAARCYAEAQTASEARGVTTEQTTCR